MALRVSGTLNTGLSSLDGRFLRRLSTVYNGNNAKLTCVIVALRRPDTDTWADSLHNVAP